MGWLTSLLGLVSRFFKWRDDEARRAEGVNKERRQTAAVIKEKADVADKIRVDVAAGIAADPASLRDDDGFKRPG